VRSASRWRSGAAAAAEVAFGGGIELLLLVTPGTKSKFDMPANKN
jgi:hypothetical protein